MSIEKKSLISTLKTAKKANAASSGPEASHVVSKRQTKMVSKRQTKMVSKRAADRA